MNSLVISNFKTGYEKDKPPFQVNNDAFPTLANGFIWRGRCLKKRGTQLLGRLQRGTTALAIGSFTGPNFDFNIYTVANANGYPIPEANPQIVPGSVIIVMGAETYTDNGLGTLVGAPNPLTNFGTINYVTGAVTITTTVVGATPVTITFNYYPDLPVMGLEDFLTDTGVNFPTLVGFDTTYSYQFNEANNAFYDVSFYKITNNPVTWSGGDFQQFWSQNYGNAMFVTNGKPGFQFKQLTANFGLNSITDVGPQVVNVGLNAHGITTIGELLWFNEVDGTIGGNRKLDNTNINTLIGRVTTITDANNLVVTFDGTFGSDSANFGGGTVGLGGIVQFLTKTVAGAGDGIRWYDGDPNGSSGRGWVNFAPPLTLYIPGAGNNPNPQYLVGAQSIFSFKDRLLFFNVTYQQSNGTGLSFQNRVEWSQNGTAFYNSLVPTPFPPNSPAGFQSSAWYYNVIGRGGFQTGPQSQRTISVIPNEDVLLVGFDTKQTKLLYTSDDTNPFIYQTINSEFGSLCTFAGIALDQGGLFYGDYGIGEVTQVSAQRIDLQIPDNVFNIRLTDNGDQRVCSVRDFQKELIYFTYPTSINSDLFQQGGTSWKFPTQTLIFNYREKNWGLLVENFTHYGTYRRGSSMTWGTLNKYYKTWGDWSVPWNSGVSEKQFPQIIGGNQQGFVMKKTFQAKEDNSQYISAIAGGVNITSPDHCLQNGEFIQINNCIFNGATTNPNGQVYQIFVNPTLKDTFVLLPYIDPEGNVQPVPTGTYLGGGTYIRLANFVIRTKQFPIFWEKARQTRIGTQRFLFENTASQNNPTSEVTVQIFTSQVSSLPDNDPLSAPFTPFSNVLLTGQTNTNPFQILQNQIWTRSSNSFIGDTVQVGLTLSSDQMRDISIASSEVVLYSIAIDLYPGPILV